MSKADAIHELYRMCRDINFDETYELLSEAESAEERAFIRTVTDFSLQQRQRRVVQEKRF